MIMNIQPHAQPAPTAVTLNRTNIRIFASPNDPTRTVAVIDGEILDSNGVKINGVSYCMTPDEYDAWGSDDLYPTTLLATRNGLTPA